MQRPVRKIVIAGGGTAGWMTAAALARVVNARHTTITLVESEAIGTVGVGEATIPAIHDFNRRLGVDEKAMMRASKATFKLGIEFRNWQTIGKDYMHPFGTYGQDLNGVGFHNYWLSRRRAGDNYSFDEYSLPTLAARAGRFRHPLSDPRSVYSSYSYAYHFDASRYGQYLRSLAESLGVRRIEGRIKHVALHPESGFIDQLDLESGANVDGDLFIDCSGFRGLLIGQALGVDYEDWQQWLPCDRAFAAPTIVNEEPLPYTRATAHDAGWQWRIPLQHRVGNGYVFSSRFCDETSAEETLRSNLDGDLQDEPRMLRFTPGKRREMWRKNCIAVGLSSGFLEPLESTSIYLIQAAVMKLLEFFPDAEFAAVDIAEFNRSMDTMYDEVRNFIILHYKATERDDSEFWKYCRNMSVPDELAYRIQLFRDRALVSHRRNELFIETNWLAVLIGQGIVPNDLDPRTDGIDERTLSKRMQLMRDYLHNAVDALPSHSEALNESATT